MLLCLQAGDTKWGFLNQIPLSKLSMERNLRKGIVCSQNQEEVEESVVKQMKTKA